MEFTFAGFRQVSNVRQFVFHAIANRTRMEFTVRADLALTRRYQIALQELPLLCLRVLEGLPDGEQARAFTFSEEDMRAFAERRAAVRDQAARRRKRSRPPASRNLGRAWRTQGARK